MDCIPIQRRSPSCCSLQSPQVYRSLSSSQLVGLLDKRLPAHVCTAYHICQSLPSQSTAPTTVRILISCVINKMDFIVLTRAGSTRRSSSLIGVCCTRRAENRRTTAMRVMTGKAAQIAIVLAGESYPMIELLRAGHSRKLSGIRSAIEIPTAR